MKQKTLWIFALLLTALLTGCELPEQWKEITAKSAEASAAIEKQVGIKPSLSIFYQDGTIAKVDVNFAGSPSLSIIELEKIIQTAFREAFLLNPENQFQINLTFNKEAT
ncbi:hypothetical protein ACH518_18710 [Methylomonas sp. HW2-6]|uniref:hypothetical protein n=1 Tax=Methylomonas sp. HW2-6 TaxID=3376687 RepID=UPI0040433B13